MAALYEFGTFTSPIDLLGKIDLYLVNVLGWTRNMAPTLIAGQSGYRAHYQRTITKLGVARTLFINFYASGSASDTPHPGIPSAYLYKYYGLYIYGSTGFDNVQLWHAQPGQSVSAITGNVTTARIRMHATVNTTPSYSFFGSVEGDFFGFVGSLNTEVSAGYPTIICAGVMDKSTSGPYVGGEFFGTALATFDSRNYWNNESYVESLFPFYTTDISYAYRTPLLGGFFVRATVDGTENWVSICSTLVVPTGEGAIDNNFKTQFIGLGNVWGAVAAWGSAENNNSLSIPCLNNTYGYVSQVTGVIRHGKLQCAVVVPSTQKHALLGDLPLMYMCMTDGILPRGYQLQGKWYNTNIAVDMIDV